MAAFQSYKQRLKKKVLWQNSTLYKFLYILLFITGIVLICVVIQSQSDLDPVLKLWILCIGLGYVFVFRAIIKPLIYRSLVKSGKISQKDIDDKVAAHDKKFDGLAGELFSNRK